MARIKGEKTTGTRAADRLQSKAGFSGTRNMIRSRSERFKAAKPRKVPLAGRKGIKVLEALNSLETRIREKLSSYAAIRHLDLEWSSAVGSGKTPYDSSKAKRFQSLYKDWTEGTEELIKSLREMEAKGLAVAGSLEFRDTVGYCPAGLDPDVTLATFERLEQGEGVVVHEGNCEQVLRRHTS